LNSTFWNNSSTRSFVYNSSDSIGIGTTVPTEKLHLQNGNLKMNRSSLTAENTIIFNMPTPSLASEFQGLKFQVAGLDRSAIRYISEAVGNPATQGIRISGNGIGSDDIFINTSGNVGIGNRLPAEKLDVSGNINMDAINPILQLQNSGVDKGFMQLNGDDIRIGTNSSNSNGRFIVRVNAQENFAVTGAGNVGIGTIAPAAKLHIAGNTRMVSSGEVLRIDGTNPTINFYNNGSYKSFLQHTSSGLYMGVNDGNIRLDVTNGQVAIGPVVAGATAYKLAVNGKIIAEELKVKLSGSWPDYVFEKKYALRTLPDLEKFIEENNHLPNIPSAEEVEKYGMEVGDMQKRMMEKIEELTLYVIDLQKQIEELKANKK
jgi:hypothetical protein